MIRRPPRSTRTDTLFPYTTLFRSVLEELLRELKLTSSEVTTINPFGEIWRILDEGTAEGDDWQIEQFALAPYIRLVDEFCRESLRGIAIKRVGSGIVDTFFQVSFNCEQCHFLAHFSLAISVSKYAVL